MTPEEGECQGTVCVRVCVCVCVHSVVYLLCVFNLVCGVRGRQSELSVSQHSDAHIYV